MLRVVVQPWVQERGVGVWHLKKGEEQCAEHRQRHRTGQNYEGVAEAVELGCQHQEYQDYRQAEGR